MSFISSQQHLFTPSPSRITSYYFTKNPNFSFHFTTPSHFPNLHCNPKSLTKLATKPQNFNLKGYESDEIPQSQSQIENDFNFDYLLSVTEFLCVVSSAIITVSYAVNCTVLTAKMSVFRVLGSSKAVAWGLVVMASGMAIGAWIRRRQWDRISKVRVSNKQSVDLVSRIEKLEEDIKSSASIVRVLSRQLEKLGIRFRVTRKSLKEPIAETAAMAQKNSEATRALAMQEDILEKELGEIQKVLLAMQEQQQKQLELILAVAKSGKLWEGKQEPVEQKDTTSTSGLTKGEKKLETQEIQASAKGTNNDRP